MLADNLHGKTRQLGDYILEQIYTGRYVPGTSIPSIRTYMEQFGMSQRTVQRTLKILVERGILDSRHGQGTFVMSRPERTRTGNRTIAVSLRRGSIETSIYGNVFLGLQQAALEMDCQLKVDNVPDPANLTDKTQLSKLITGTKGLIVLSEKDERLRNNKLPVPAAGVCMYDNYNDTVSLLDLDPFSSSWLAIDFFRERGINKVSIFSADVPSYMTRGNVFAEQWREQGGKCEISLLTPNLTGKYEVQDDSGLLFTTGSIKELFLRHYHKQTGIKLEERNAVLELDGKSRLNPEYIKNPSITPNWQQIGRMALEEVLYRVNSPGTPPRRIFIPGKLHLD